jgi:hypothetical protein
MLTPISLVTKTGLYASIKWEINYFRIWTPSRATKCDYDENAFPLYSEEASLPDLTKITV